MKKNAPSETLDETDVQILRHLQDDGRLSNAKLAQRVALSETPCWHRLRKLESEGYIQSFKVVEPKDGEPQGTLRVQLKYGPRGERVITGIQRVSRPGRRVYFGRDSVPDVLAGLGCSILTTSRGVMTGREAVKAGVGGEVLCNVW